MSVETGAVSTLADPGWLVAAQSAWLPVGKSLLVIARAHDQLAAQIRAVSYPEGKARRVTSDLNGGPAVRVTSFEDQFLFGFAISRDATTLALVRGPRLRDAQLITGFGAYASASGQRER